MRVGEMGVNREAALQVALGPFRVAGLELRNPQQQPAVGIVGPRRRQLACNGLGLLR